MMLEAIERLRGRGYRIDLAALPGGLLRCGECGSTVAAAGVDVDETVRFEGDSNPDDEEILVAISLPCGHLGLFSAAYGPDTPPEESQVLEALRSD